MDIREFQRLVLEKAKAAGFDDCEIYYQGGESMQMLSSGGKIEHFETSSSSGAAFRGMIKGKTGFAYTERITRKRQTSSKRPPQKMPPMPMTRKNVSSSAAESMKSSACTMMSLTK